MEFHLALLYLLFSQLIFDSNRTTITIAKSPPSPYCIRHFRNASSLVVVIGVDEKRHEVKCIPISRYFVICSVLFVRYVYIQQTNNNDDDTNMISMNYNIVPNRMIVFYHLYSVCLNSMFCKDLYVGTDGISCANFVLLIDWKSGFVTKLWVSMFIPFCLGKPKKKQKKIMSVCAIPIFTIQLSVCVVLVKSLFFNSICLLFGSSCYVVWLRAKS